MRTLAFVAALSLTGSAAYAATSRALDVEAPTAAAAIAGHDDPVAALGRAVLAVERGATTSCDLPPVG